MVSTVVHNGEDKEMANSPEEVATNKIATNF